MSLFVGFVGCGSSSDTTSHLILDGSIPPDAGQDAVWDAPSDAPSVCIPAVTQPCYTGPTATNGMGACHAGVQVCAADGSGFGECVAEVTPVDETCATPIDDDCDGQTNEDGAGCNCVPGQVSECYSGPAETVGVGACKAGSQVCKPGGVGFGDCLGEVVPASETCNTPVDDDCDGELNEEGAGCLCVPGSSESCYSGPTGTEGVGACAAGTRTCGALGKAWGPCVGEVVPATEVCSTAVDDDCDGQVNEDGADCVCSPGATTSCYTGPAQTLGEGACTAGTQTCNATGSGYGACAGEVTPVPESCDTWIDDDCDRKPECPGDVALVHEYGSAGLLATASGNPVAGLLTTEQGTLPSKSDVHLVTFGNDGQLTGKVLIPGVVAPSRLAIPNVPPSLVAFVSGRYSGSPDLGGGPLPNASSALFAARYTTKGAHVWSQAYGGTPTNAWDVPFAAVTKAGNLVLAGKFNGATDFGNGVTIPDGSGPQLVQVDGTSGIGMWSRPLLAGPGSINLQSVDRLGEGVVLGAQATGSVDFGGGPTPPTTHYALEALDAAGQHKWTRAIAPVSGTNLSVYTISISTGYESEGVAICGQTKLASVDFGGGPVSPGGFIVIYDANGNVETSLSYPACTFYSIYLDRHSWGTAAYVVGNCTSPVVTPQGALSGPIVLSVENGAPKWVRAYGSGGNIVGMVSAQGELWWIGAVQKSSSYDLLTVPELTNEGLFWARVTP